MIIADDSANPAWIAADMLAQAEHDEHATALLVANSEALVDDVDRELRQQIRGLPREAIARKSLEHHGCASHCPAVSKMPYGSRMNMRPRRSCSPWSDHKKRRTT